MRVDNETAKERLSELVKAVLAGEEVIIVAEGGSLVKLVPLPWKTYQLGGLEGVIPRLPDSFFDPLGEEELREWE